MRPHIGWEQLIRESCFIAVVKYTGSEKISVSSTDQVKPFEAHRFQVIEVLKNLPSDVYTSSFQLPANQGRLGNYATTKDIKTGSAIYLVDVRLLQMQNTRDTFQVIDDRRKLKGPVELRPGDQYILASDSVNEKWGFFGGSADGNLIGMDRLKEAERILQPTSSDAHPKTTTVALSNRLEVEFSVLSPKIKRAEELQVKAIFTNAAKERLRLKTLFLNLPVVLLKVRKAEKGGKSPVLLGPPPMPPADDGKAGREDLEPGQRLEFLYKGSDIFGGKTLPPGEYEIRFRYENLTARPPEWKGVIETDWVEFRVGG